MGGSSSAVKNKQSNHTVSENERIHQKPQTPVNSNPVKESLEQETIKCRKHIRNDVTHICESTQELVCLNCAQRMTHMTEYKQSCIDIDTYTNSLKFKQIDARTSEQLRTRKTFLDEEIKLIEYNEKRAASKRDEMLDEVKTFVGRLVELVRHMEKDLYSKVNSKIDNYSTNLKHRREYIQTWQEELMAIQENIARHRSQSKATALHLKSVLECKAFVSSVKSNVHPMKETPDYRLKLNKQLTLKDVVGRKTSTGNISLGEIFHDNGDSTRDDLLSTISENDISENMSVTQESVKTLKRSRLTIVGSKSGSKSGHSDIEMMDINEELNDNHNLGNETRVASSTRENKIHPLNDSTKEVDDDEKYSIKPPQQINGHMRHRFGKDLDMAGNIPRSKSPTKSLAITRLTTPRTSNNSIMSPMSITTPSRINLLPTREAIRSVHGKIAVKIKTIKILCDGDMPNFTDSIVLDDGKIVLCDQKNEKLILLSTRFKQLDELQLRGQPHNITKTTTDNKTIAVTIPEKNMIQFIWVLAQKLEDPNKSITSKPKCRGITYIENHLLYTSRNDVIVLKEGNKSKPWKFDCAFREPVSLYADKQTNSLFVCCIGLKSSGEVVKIDFDRTKVEQIMHFSDIKHPVCCSQDSDQNVYICDIDPPCIHLVSSGGHYCRLVLDSDEGNIQHINFSPGSDVFITTENNSDDINIYELR